MVWMCSNFGFEFVFGMYLAVVDLVDLVMIYFVWFVEIYLYGSEVFYWVMCVVGGELFYVYWLGDEIWYWVGVYLIDVVIIWLWYLCEFFFLLFWMWYYIVFFDVMMLVWIMVVDVIVVLVLVGLFGVFVRW